MKDEDRLYLRGVAKSLRITHRFRNRQYVGEGHRYIRMSDRLATQIADRLEKIAKRPHVARGDV